MKISFPDELHKIIKINYKKLHKKGYMSYKKYIASKKMWN